MQEEIINDTLRTEATLVRQSAGETVAHEFARLPLIGEGQRRRVAFLNRSYSPDSGATGQLLEQLSIHLAPIYDVTVVAGTPDNQVRQAGIPNTDRQDSQTVRVERLRHTTFDKRRLLGRLTNLATFTWKVRAWGTQAPKFDAVISETDPFFLPLVAAPLAKRMGAKYIAYIQDVYPDIGIALGMQGENLLTRALRERLRRAYLRADRIVVLDEDMRDRLAWWGLPRDKFVIISNWVDTTKVRPLTGHNAFRAQHALQGRFVVMHSGNMGLTQRLDQLVQATTECAWPERALLLLIGDGVRRTALQSEIEKWGVQDRVRILPPQPAQTLSTSLSAANIHVVSLDGSLWGCMFPSKLYGILAVGKATLAVVPTDGSVDRLVRQHRLGLSVLPNSPIEFARAVRYAMEHPDELQQYGSNARQLAVQQFDKLISCNAFETVLAELWETPATSLTKMPAGRATSQASAHWSGATEGDDSTALPVADV